MKFGIEDVIRVRKSKRGKQNGEARDRDVRSTEKGLGVWKGYKRGRGCGDEGGEGGGGTGGGGGGISG